MTTYFVATSQDIPDNWEIWIAERKGHNLYHALIQDLDRSYDEGELFETDILFGDPECLLMEECLMIG